MIIVLGVVGIPLIGCCLFPPPYCLRDDKMAELFKCCCVQEGVMESRTKVRLVATIVHTAAMIMSAYVSICDGQPVWGGACSVFHGGCPGASRLEQLPSTF